MKEGAERMIDLKDRLRQFSLKVIEMYALLPKQTVAQVLGKQVLRSGTSVGAHHREALRARSKFEFISKLEGGMQELEETMYWFELIVGSRILKEEQISALNMEADELMAILTTIVKKEKAKK